MNNSSQKLGFKTGKSGLVKSEVEYGWVPQGEYVEIAGRIIPGMVYICDSRKPMHEEDDWKDLIWIDISELVSGRDDKGLQLQYINYCDMSPACRGSYLDWLANGRNDKNYHQDYALRYFYALEHRYLCKVITDSESQQITDELTRLKNRYADFKKLQGYVEELFEYKQILSENSNKNAKLSCDADLPFDLYIEISNTLYDSAVLTGDQVFKLFQYSIGPFGFNPNACLEYKEDFIKEFEKAYPKGMEVKKPKYFLNWGYASSSGEFDTETEAIVDGRPVYEIAAIREAHDTAEHILADIVQNSENPMAFSSGNEIVDIMIRGD